MVIVVVKDYGGQPAANNTDKKNGKRARAQPPEGWLGESPANKNKKRVVGERAVKLRHILEVTSNREIPGLDRNWKEKLLPAAQKRSPSPQPEQTESEDSPDPPTVKLEEKTDNDEAEKPDAKEAAEDWRESLKKMLEEIKKVKELPQIEVPETLKRKTVSTPNLTVDCPTSKTHFESSWEIRNRYRKRRTEELVQRARPVSNGYSSWRDKIPEMSRPLRFTEVRSNAATDVSFIGSMYVGDGALKSVCSGEDCQYTKGTRSYRFDGEIDKVRITDNKRATYSAEEQQKTWLGKMYNYSDQPKQLMIDYTDSYSSNPSVYRHCSTEYDGLQSQKSLVFPSEQALSEETRQTSLPSDTETKASEAGAESIDENNKNNYFESDNNVTNSNNSDSTNSIESSAFNNAIENEDNDDTMETNSREEDKSEKEDRPKEEGEFGDIKSKMAGKIAELELVERKKVKRHEKVEQAVEQPKQKTEQKNAATKDSNGGDWRAEIKQRDRDKQLARLNAMPLGMPEYREPDKLQVMDWREALKTSEEENNPLNKWKKIDNLKKTKFPSKQKHKEPKSEPCTCNIGNCKAHSQVLLKKIGLKSSMKKDALKEDTVKKEEVTLKRKLTPKKKPEDIKKSINASSHENSKQMQKESSVSLNVKSSAAPIHETCLSDENNKENSSSYNDCSPNSLKLSETSDEHHINIPDSDQSENCGTNDNQQPPGENAKKNLQNKVPRERAPSTSKETIKIINFVAIKIGGEEPPPVVRKRPVKKTNSVKKKPPPPTAKPPPPPPEAQLKVNAKPLPTEEPKLPKPPSPPPAPAPPPITKTRTPSPAPKPKSPTPPVPQVKEPSSPLPKRKEFPNPEVSKPSPFKFRDIKPNYVKMKRPEPVETMPIARRPRLSDVEVKPFKMSAARVNYVKQALFVCDQYVGCGENENKDLKEILSVPLPKPESPKTKAVSFADKLSSVQAPYFNKSDRFNQNCDTRLGNEHKHETSSEMKSSKTDSNTSWRSKLNKDMKDDTSTNKLSQSGNRKKTWNKYMWDSNKEKNKAIRDCSSETAQSVDKDSSKISEANDCTQTTTSKSNDKLSKQTEQPLSPVAGKPRRKDKIGSSQTSRSSTPCSPRENPKQRFEAFSQDQKQNKDLNGQVLSKVQRSKSKAGKTRNAAATEQQNSQAT